MNCYVILNNIEKILLSNLEISYNSEEMTLALFLTEYFDSENETQIIKDISNITSFTVYDLNDNEIQTFSDLQLEFSIYAYDFYEEPVKKNEIVLYYVGVIND